MTHFPFSGTSVWSMSDRLVDQHLDLGLSNQKIHLEHDFNQPLHQTEGKHYKTFTPDRN